MKPVLLPWLLGACLALANTAALAVDVTITPVTVYLTRASDRSTVSIANRGAEAVTMQAESIGWQRVDGVDQDLPTQDVMVNPAIFTIQPGQSQIIRLGLRKKPSFADETTYRLVLREIPTADNAPSKPDAGSAVRVLMAFRVPVYVMPDQVQREQHWQASTSLGKLNVSVQNTGNVHYKIGQLKLLPAQAGNGDKPLAQLQTPALLFPGEKRVFAFDTPGLRSPQKMKMEVITDTGPQYVDLDISPQ